MAGDFVPLHLAVLTVSDRRTLEDDRSGAMITDLAREAGHVIVDRAVVRDEVDAIRAKLIGHRDDPGVDAVLATGGTGLAPRDVTPEALAGLVTKPIPGFGELFRWLSYQEIGTSTLQSRAEAGLCDDTLVVLLPGSPGACRLAMTSILLPQLDHRHRPCNFAELLPRIRSRGSGGT